MIKNIYSIQSFYTSSSQVEFFGISIFIARGISSFVDYLLPSEDSKFRSACTTYLSPTGMVQPVSSFALNPSYNNHFSFIQAASKNWIKRHPTSCCDYNTTVIGGSFSYEEQLVVSNAGLFNPTTGIFDISIASQMVEILKGRYIWKKTYRKYRNVALFDCDFIYRNIFNN